MTIQQANYLVLGATGSIGYAFAMELLKRGERVTVLVRDGSKAAKLFGQAPNLLVAEGDAQDLELMKRLGRQATHIFHGINYPYNKWEGNMERVTQNVIVAASQNHATILFPGNVYNYGNIKTEITEDTPMEPGTKKGAIRVMLEQMLQQAAAEGKCRVLVLRLPDFWGPNVLNEGIAPIFRAALKGEAMPWLVRNDIPHQLVYTPDAARVFYELVQLQPQEPYALYNYGGEVMPSIKAWQAQLASIAGNKPRHRLYSKTFISIMGLFIPVLRELKEMLYLFENTILLNDDKLHRVLPQFTETPMQQAMQETLAWFRKN
ncbi:NAD-dependent epimerase/dehydratase family protein [Pontibacter ruber]|uniref:NAD-dependent epimerase/dehydratase family protein n=1 Tax=Pontibacter ruber TaxID=1343895 RepID=A0ABW5D1X6_9BACT|nr:NAD-dependent epimerase/dehydratase family protein [Pontibacter ruber]